MIIVSLFSSSDVASVIRGGLGDAARAITGGSDVLVLVLEPKLVVSVAVAVTGSVG